MYLGKVEDGVFLSFDVDYLEEVHLSLGQVEDGAHLIFCLFNFSSFDFDYLEKIHLPLGQVEDGAHVNLSASPSSSVTLHRPLRGQ